MSPRTDPLAQRLRALRMPTAATAVSDILDRAQRDDWPLETFATELLDQEIEGRRVRRIARLARASKLPADKTLDALDKRRLPLRIRRQLPLLCEGDFLDRADNILIFGLPGKSHVAAALGHELVHRGRSVLFTPTFRLVDRLLRAKRDLEIEAELRRLDRFQLLVLDDFGYVQQSREEMEVLFTLLAERYERRSVLITSNLVFSEWDQIFKDPLTTAAAIDRVVHHSVILEFGRDVSSFRADEASKRHLALHEQDGSATAVALAAAPTNN